MKGGVVSRSGLIKVALLSMVMLLVVLVCTLIFPLFHQNSLWYIGFLVVSFCISWILLGFRLRKSNDGGLAVQIMVIYVLFFLLLIYVLGLVTGFLRSAYGFEPLTIIRNTLPVVAIVVITELLRYTFVKRIGDNLKLLIVLVICFSGMSIAVGLSNYSLNSPLAVFEVVGRLGLGSVAANLMLTFVAWKSDYRPTIIYMLIMSLYPILVPILPDLGVFIYSVLAIVLPTLLFTRFNALFETKRVWFVRGSRTREWLITTPILVMLGAVVVLVSGVFRYWATAIGSESMTPNIDMGDVVIIDKGYDDLSQIKEGEVLAFNHDGRVIVHRIVKIYNANSKYSFQTQGDSNALKDSWIVAEDDIVGVVRWRIPYIGWPTIWMTRAL
jgi:signal peptidase